MCLSVIIKVFTHTLVESKQTYVFYGRLSHITQAISHSFLVCVSLQAAGCFQEKLQLRFCRKCDLQGREKQCVLSSIRTDFACYSDLKLQDKCEPGLPPRLQNTCVVYTVFLQQMQRRDTHIYSPQQLLNCPIMYITATVKQTPIIPRRCDSNPPVSPFKALEAPVLRWHVSACLTQSWQHQQRSLHAVAPNRLAWRQWIQGNINIPHLHVSYLQLVFFIIKSGFRKIL